MISLISLVVGGMALFLYGMGLATDGLREAAGGRLRATLTVLTARRTWAVLTGGVVAFLLSSSSAVAVMLIDLADARLLSLRRAILLLLGAGVGIALTVQLFAFPIASWALLIVAAGLVIRAAARYRRRRALGVALVGAGLVFYGLALVNQGIGEDAGRVVNTLSPWLGWPVAGFLVGAAVSAFLRSAATVCLAMVLAGHGLPLEQLVPVVLGATVGSCALPMIVSFKTGRDGRQVAAAELFIRLVVAMALLAVAWPLADFVREGTVRFGLASGAEDLARRSVANAMLFVSVLTVAVAAPVAGPLAAFVKRLSGNGHAAAGVSDVAPSDPEEVLAQVHREVVRMAGMSREIIGRAARAVLDNDERELERLEADDESIDALDHVLTQRLDAILSADVAPEALEAKSKLLYAIKDLESAADLATRELTRIGWEKSRDNVRFDDTQRRDIEEVLRLVDDGLASMEAVIRGDDPSELARVAVVDGAREIDRRRLALFDAQSARVAESQPGAAASNEAYINMVNDLRMAHFLAADVVRAISEPAPGGEAGPWHRRIGRSNAAPRKD